MFYRPENSVAADVIPFYKDGEFYLFYLRDYRNIEKCGEGTPWFLLKTKDFVSFEEMGEVLPRGGKEEQDLYVFTGSVIQKDEVNYIFYTGHNPHYIEDGRPQEAVMMATSTDMKIWTKQSDFLLQVPDFMEKNDFRDPFVFWNEEIEKYVMLLAARHKTGAVDRRGYTAYAVSDDLWNWEVKEEAFYDPGVYFTHECPDLFQIGEWWYLVFSEFTDKVITRYRMAKSWNGPWITPEYDTFDNRNFYAAKTVTDGKNRFAIGWNPTNVEDKDYEPEQWGGNIVVHKVVQQEDGQLMVEMPEMVRNAYKTPVAFRKKETSGVTTKKDDGWVIGKVDGFSCLTFEKMPDQCKLSFDVTAKNGVKKFFLTLNSDEKIETGYYVWFDLTMQRMAFDRRPRRRNEHPFILETERKINIKENVVYRVECLIDHSVLEVYFDDKVALSARMNELRADYFGFGCEYGEVEIQNLRIETI